MAAKAGNTPVQFHQKQHGGQGYVGEYFHATYRVGIISSIDLWKVK